MVVFVNFTGTWCLWNQASQWTNFIFYTTRPYWNEHQSVTESRVDRYRTKWYYV